MAFFCAGVWGLGPEAGVDHRMNAGLARSHQTSSERGRHTRPSECLALVGKPGSCRLSRQAAATSELAWFKRQKCSAGRGNRR